MGTVKTANYSLVGVVYYYFERSLDLIIAKMA